MWLKTMQRKQNLASALGIEKRQLEVTMHFSEIHVIKLQLGKKKRHTLLHCCFLE